MEIIVGKTAGFCFGVANAINKTIEALGKYDDLCCLGELVHNNLVTKDLEEHGLRFIDNIENATKNVIIRAHGEPEETYKKINRLNLNKIDLTCPKVMKIHDIAKQYSQNGFYIILIGQKEHPETIGTISYCGKNCSIIQKEEEIDDVLNKIKKSGIKKILIISQTTFSLEKFNIITNIISKNIDKDCFIELNNTICSATKQRQEETYEIAKNVEFMIIIGGKHSSNTNKLYNIANENCKNSILIENEQELDLNYLKKFKSIGIMAGASTPEKSIKSVVEMLNKI